MSSWSSSKVVTSKSWAVLKENAYLLTFPVAAMLLGLIPFAIFGLPALYFFAVNQNWVAAAFGIVAVFASQAVATLIQGGLVASVDTELSGDDSSFGAGMSRAFQHTGALLAWSGIVTVVSLLFSLLRGNGQGSVVGVLLRNIVAAAGEVLWTLITFFVVPFIVLEGTSPIEAIKASASLVRKKWGTQIAGGIRIGGLIILAIILPAAIILGLGIFLVIAGSLVFGIPLAIVGVLGVLIGMVLSQAMRTVFAVALYRYASTGAVSGAFTEAELQSAVQVKA
ncbi:MAG: hypothetical protein GC156_08080 [Actinomycetales bacterium]|nr:hypothetical protein [Actinomycetales bacterium]